MKMTSYALCSTPTTPHTGPGHDLQHTDRDTPCSSKHIEGPCSLQHIDYSTICFGHVPHRTDDSYHLQGHVPIQATGENTLRRDVSFSLSFLRTEHGSLVQKNPLTKASARWELVKEWLEKCVEHWNPKEEYWRQFILSGGINHQSGSFSQAATPRSVVGSRFSEDPSF
ncbi:hypothetical protein DY000_02040780 [Brassica cretica]|uniref:Aminotransferase-like plant mobile domain-containing protein n=1 Tax=Brassica cretica TaxID=69181 RepID=A0ABQ7BQS3_BRACR|nr:hypothetical protein DY000_02040780 [Brassica cretica]